VTTELYPEFNVFEVAEPYAAELMRSQLSPSALLQRGFDEASNYGGLLLELPYQVHDTLEQFRDGEVEVQFRHKGLDMLANKADVVFNRLVIAIVMTATVVGGALIGIGANGGPHWLGIHLVTWLGLVVASFLAFILVLSIMRSGRL